MTGVVEGDGGPLPAAVGAAAVSPTGDAGVEDGEGDAVGAAAEPKGEIERGLDDAAVAHGDDGLSRVAVDECGDRGARAGEEGHPALPAGREGGERVADGRRSEPVPFPPLVEGEAVGLAGPQLVQLVVGLYPKVECPCHVLRGLQ